MTLITSHEVSLGRIVNIYLGVVVKMSHRVNDYKSFCVMLIGGCFY